MILRCPPVICFEQNVRTIHTLTAKQSNTSAKFEDAIEYSAIRQHKRGEKNIIFSVNYRCVIFKTLLPF